jgi:TorA maturation chaperone TorD
MEIIITQKDIIEVYRSFKICLEFLSKVFLEIPRVEFIEQLVKKDLFSEWPLPGREAMSEGLRLMQAFCAYWQPSQHKEVRLDFTQLFTGCEKLLLLSNLCGESAEALDVDKP